MIFNNRMRVEILVPFLLFAAVAFETELQAQLVRIDRSAFSDRAIRLPLERLISGAEASDALSLYGPTFLAQGGIARKQVSVIQVGVPPIVDHVIQNEPLEGTSTGKSLLLRFSGALRRVGFVLSNGSGQTVATISAETVRGEPLGSVRQTGIDPRRGPFIGLETDHEDGIGAISIDYGMEESPEQIADVLLESLTPSVYRVILPQVASGKLGDDELSTVVQLQTLAPTGGETIAVSLSFFDGAGAPAPLRIEGEADTTFDLELPPSTFRELVVEPQGPGAFAGYASIESSVPILAQVLYRVTRSVDEIGRLQAAGLLQSEAGIRAVEGDVYSSFPVRRDPTDGRDVGIALVNLGDQPNPVRIAIFDAAGETPAQLRNPLTFTLERGEHRAFFLSQLCMQSPPSGFACIDDFLAGRAFQGALEVASQQPVAVAVLNTSRGVPVSSLPAGSLRR